MNAWLDYVSSGKSANYPLPKNTNITHSPRQQQLCPCQLSAEFRFIFLVHNCMAQHKLI